ncbi:MAG: hypothetical protein DMF80_23530 [Acidobacteria bacterium]|nr:MAG: hypothetical protein DMF80_23530 [Acidobacteriota bacterium]PYQ25503.1 MAG: hypothetical protein DMF81_02095 [Acidobacteriota bacterium]
MSRTRPVSGCRELAFHDGYVVDDSGEVALEDYAREMTRAREVEVVRTGGERGPVTGVHLCGLDAEPAAAVRADVEDFARELATRSGGGGLGWS